MTQEWSLYKNHGPPEAALMGLGIAKGKLICDKPRACIYIGNNVKSLKINDFCARAIVVTKVNMATGSGNTVMLVAAV